VAADSDDPMKVLRRLSRSGVLATILAFALALSGVLGTQMAARHSVEANAAAVFKIICHADGLADAQTPDEGQVRRDGCPCGPLCGSQQIAAPANNTTGVVCTPEWAATVVYAQTDQLRAWARAPRDFEARGPPRMI
jgi:hypothetical protein